MATIAHRSFASGEISPTLYARVDQSRYQTGLRTCRNMFIQRHGGAASRPGTTFVEEVVDSSKLVQLIPFVGPSGNYMLEFNGTTNAKFRVIKDGVYVTETVKLIEGVTKAADGVMTITAHGFTSGDTLYISGIAGMTQLNGQTITVTVVDADTFTIGVDTSGYGAYTSGGVAKVMTGDGVNQITGINLGAANAVITSPGHAFANNDRIYISGIVGTTELNGQYFTVANIAANTFELKDRFGTAILSANLTAWSSGGNAARVYTVTTSLTNGATAVIGPGGFKYTQDGDTLTVVGSSITPAEITHTGDQFWTVTSLSSLGNPSISAPTSLANGSYGNGTQAFWVVTAVAANGEESLQSNTDSSTQAPALATQCSLSWVAPTTGTAIYYNIYRWTGVWSYIGSSSTTSFVDFGQTPDSTITPPELLSWNTPSDSSGKPTCVAYYQQRMIYGGRSDVPGKLFASRIGNRSNFTTAGLIQDDDTAVWTQVGPYVRSVRNVVPLKNLVVLTAGAEFVVPGNGNGVLTPIDINPSIQTTHGCKSYPMPEIIDGSAVYVTDTAAQVRDLEFNFETDGYRGNELSLFSQHLIDDGYPIVAWAWQKNPHRVLWIVKGDGSLISMTYVKDQAIIGWARHDSGEVIGSLGGIPIRDCQFLDVKVIPGSSEDQVHFVVQRTVNNSSKRYVEVLSSRNLALFYGGIRNYVGMDCALTYDGETDGSITMTLSGGTTWAYDETLTLTASGSFFVSGDVGNQIFLYTTAGGYTGDVIRFTIEGYTSGTVVTGKPHATVPVALRSAATALWRKAVDTLSGLDHLEGKAVSVFADGGVVASPHNPDYDTITVTDGSITLDKPYSRITVGLPYFCDLETLDIDDPQSGALINKNIQISQVAAHVENTRGMWFGPHAPSDDTVDATENLIEKKISRDNYNDATALETGIETINILPEWKSKGRVFIRQIDPLPMTILAVAPSGMIPGGR